MKLNDVQKRLLSQKQVKKPYMMKGGKLPKAQIGTSNRLREITDSILRGETEQRRKELDQLINLEKPIMPVMPDGPMFRPNPYERMDSTQLANVFQDEYGGYRFMNTGLEGESYSDIQNQIMQKFIESQGRMDPTVKFPMFRDPSGRLSFKKGGTTKGSGSNGVL